MFLGRPVGLLRDDPEDLTPRYGGGDVKTVSGKCGITKPPNKL